MCGVTGFWGAPNHEHVLLECVGPMVSALAHRGPDAAGTWVDGRLGIALGHRRLSILDLSDQGRQPMMSDDGRWVIVYNGEVYNAPEMARELTGRHSVAFRGHSDTEVLVEGIAKWGVQAAVRRCIGMFAFAAFDRKNEVLYLVRDRLGIKPLYYGLAGGTLFFGSELMALRKHPAWRTGVDREALAAYLGYGVVPGNRSIFSGVRKVRPGTILSFPSAGEPREEIYWSARRVAAQGRQSPTRLDERDAIDELGRLLRNAVKCRLLADVPVGAFLSGGIDSTTVTALMQAESGTAATFSIGFEEQQYDESERARKVAVILGTSHHELIVSPEMAQGVVRELGSVYDEPFADASQIPTVLVSRLASRSVKVVLSGDGGDEVFGGYNRYLWAPRIWGVARRVPRYARQVLGRKMSHLRPGTWAAFYDRVAPFLPKGFRVRVPEAKVAKVLRVLASRSAADVYSRLRLTGAEAAVLGVEPGDEITFAREIAPWSFEEQMMLLDLESYLPDDILTKVDRATMSVGLEARVPLLDHRVVEFAWSLPLEMKVRGGIGKRALRGVLTDHLGMNLEDEPKMGFSVPLGAWLRGALRPWADALLEPSRLRKQDLFDTEVVGALWAGHLSGAFDHASALWPILMFQAWAEAWSVAG